MLGCVLASYQGPALFLLPVMRQHQETGIFGRFKAFGVIILVLVWGGQSMGQTPVSYAPGLILLVAYLIWNV